MLIHQIQERDDTIQDKSKRIYDLKKKNQELEKFKFVLDYKIMELRKQIEPREEDIVVLSKQIKVCTAEIMCLCQSNSVERKWTMSYMATRSAMMIWIWPSKTSSCVFARRKTREEQMRGEQKKLRQA